MSMNEAWMQVNASNSADVIGALMRRRRAREKSGLLEWASSSSHAEVKVVKVGAGSAMEAEKRRVAARSWHLLDRSFLILSAKVSHAMNNSFLLLSTNIREFGVFDLYPIKGLDSLMEMVWDKHSFRQSLKVCHSRVISFNPFWFLVKTDRTADESSWKSVDASSHEIMSSWMPPSPDLMYKLC